MLSDSERRSVLSGIEMSSAVTAFVRMEFLRYLLRCSPPDVENPCLSAVCLSVDRMGFGCEWLSRDAAVRLRMAKRWYQRMDGGRYVSILFGSEDENSLFSDVDSEDITYLARELAGMAQAYDRMFEPVCLVFHGGQYDPAGLSWKPRPPHWHMILRGLV